MKYELLADSAVKGKHINVSTPNGVVTLAGVLDNQAAIDKAITIAKNVKGVTNVDTRALKLRK